METAVSISTALYTARAGIKTTIICRDNGGYKADSVILATGSPHSTPKIIGVSEYEGKGINYCAVCDAFFYKGKDVMVFSCCDYALAEAVEFLPIVKAVYEGAKAGTEVVKYLRKSGGKSYV